MPYSVPTTASDSISRSGFWLLKQCSRAPGQDRGWSWLIVGLIVFAIGWIDYLTGSRVSLAAIYFIPITLGTIWLGWRPAIAVAAASIVIRIAGDHANEPYSHPAAAYWNRFADFCIYLVVIWITHALITLSRELDLRVRRRTEALEHSLLTRNRLERELAEIGARERSAIGHELHDDLCQQLVGTAFAAKVLAGQLANSNPESAQEAQKIVDYVEESIRRTREIARGLLLAQINPTDLSSELALLAEKGSAGGVQCEFRAEGRPQIPNAETGAQLFRIAQEALRNALRHAAPARVDIVLSSNEEGSLLMVQDNGSGRIASEDSTGLGLRIMKHRAALIGGTLSVIPTPGAGTQIICRVPRPAMDFSS